MSKLSKEQFEAYLEQIKNLAEGPFEEMQPEIEVTNVFPEKFYELAKENDLNLDIDELHLLAERFALRRNGRSPRTARQFISQQLAEQYVKLLNMEI